MKKRPLFLITVVCSAILLVYACRRDISHLVNSNGVSMEFLETAQIYYATNAAPTYTINDKRYSLKPYWQNSWTLHAQGKTILVVPTQPINSENKDYPINRVVVFEQNGNRVANAKIVEFIGEKYDVNTNLDYLISNIGQQNIPNFNGAILQYNISYISTGSTVYVDGEKTSYIAGISINSNKNGNLKISSKLFSQLKAIKGATSIEGVVSRLRTNDFPCNNCPTNYSPSCDYVFYFVVTDTDASGNVTDGYFVYERSICTDVLSSSADSDSGSAGTTDTTQPPGGSTEMPTGSTPPPDVKSPCYEAAHLVSDYNTLPTLVNTNSLVTSLSQASNVDPLSQIEYGGNIRCTSWNHPDGLWKDNFMTNIQGTRDIDIRPGQRDHWNPGDFHWDATNGYYYGFTHYHPQGDGPSPADLFKIIEWGQSPLLSDYAARPTYQQSAFVNIVTSSGSFIVTVKNWTAAASALTQYNNNPSAANTMFLSDAAQNVNDQPSAPDGLSAIAALAQEYPGVFNFYYKGSNESSFKPYTTTRDSSNNTIVSQISC